ncbi:hypothetical protein A2740_01535 [Candidatus Nomurabacteria bacterium RIFCSPHIGHO2_01_FULL_43_16]|nr:MAG: hypothetical protein A2740_01535 [Candidatus Nomurabacteria bacterium RIFCSPHIGHO2_01_FULL_43_16]OGI97399.1 MAG: hypothetical protein A3A11_02165 [Candidatus Nomurabacteria bacterium RIFCSPLOWO2_01_FULL_43_15]
MNFKKIGIVLFLILFLFPINRILAQTTNAGFVPANIWYSQDPFEEGDKVKIYTVIFNPDSRQLSGSVIFFNNSVFLGKKDFTAEAKSVKDVYLDWTATVGEHSIFGKIENAKFLVSLGKYEEVYLAENETSKSLRTVSKKIITVADTTDPSAITNPILNIVNAVSFEPIKNIGKIIGDNTPEFIAQPTISTANMVEELRINAGIVLETKRKEVKENIRALDPSTEEAAPGSNSPEAEPSKFLKPFKYAELFALALFSTTFNNKLIFYTVLILIIFFLLRYIMKRVR